MCRRRLCARSGDRERASRSPRPILIGIEAMKLTAHSLDPLRMYIHRRTIGDVDAKRSSICPDPPPGPSRGAGQAPHAASHSPPLPSG